MSGAGTPAAAAAAAAAAAGGGAATNSPGCRAARELVVLNVGELPDARAAVGGRHKRQPLSLLLPAVYWDISSRTVRCVPGPSLPHTAVFTPLTPCRWHALHHHPHHADHARRIYAGSHVSGAAGAPTCIVEGADGARCHARVLRCYSSSRCWRVLLCRVTWQTAS